MTSMTVQFSGINCANVVLSETAVPACLPLLTLLYPAPIPSLITMHINALYTHYNNAYYAALATPWTPAASWKESQSVLYIDVYNCSRCTIHTMR